MALAHDSIPPIWMSSCENLGYLQTPRMYVCTYVPEDALWDKASVTQGMHGTGSTACCCANVVITGIYIDMPRYKYKYVEAQDEVFAWSAPGYAGTNERSH